MRSACRAYLGHRSLVGLLWPQSALVTGLVKGAETQGDRERILDNPGVALGGFPHVLLAGSPDQFLVERQVDLAASHRFRIPPLIAPPIAMNQVDAAVGCSGRTAEPPHPGPSGTVFGNILLSWYDCPVTTIAWRVGQLAAQRGWSVRRLADTAGLDEKTVRNIVAGRATRVDLDTIARLSSTLEVTPGALWTTEPDPHDAWLATAGVAGQAQSDELDAILAGREPESFDSALERATRSR